MCTLTLNKTSESDFIPLDVFAKFCVRSFPPSFFHTHILENNIEFYIDVKICRDTFLFSRLKNAQYVSSLRIARRTFSDVARREGFLLAYKSKHLLKSDKMRQKSVTVALFVARRMAFVTALLSRHFVFCKSYGRESFVTRRNNVSRLPRAVVYRPRCSSRGRARSVIGDCGSQKIRFPEVPFRERGSRVSSRGLERVVDVDRA